MPRIEDAELSSLADMLSGRQPKAEHVPDVPLSESAAIEQRAAELIQVVRERGCTEVWFGKEGLCGAHLLISQPTGVLAVRLAASVSQQEATTASSAGQSWTRLLPGKTVRASLVTLDGSTVSGLELPDDLRSKPRQPSPLTVDAPVIHSIDEIKQRLGLDPLN